MDEKTLKKANEIQTAIKEKRKAIDEIIGIQSHRTQAQHKMQILWSTIEDSRQMPCALDLKQILPELDQALQKAQVRLRKDITELEKEFDSL